MVWRGWRFCSWSANFRRALMSLAGYSCNHWRFSAKSSAIKFFRIFLKKTYHNHWVKKNRNGIGYSWFSGIHEHGDANIQQQREAIGIGKERVPEAEDIREIKLLTEEQRQPSEAVKLWIQLLVFLLDGVIQSEKRKKSKWPYQVLPKRRVDVFQHATKSLYQLLDTNFWFIKRLRMIWKVNRVIQWNQYIWKQKVW